MIRVIIVDDEVLARIGIKTFFDHQEDMKVEGCFSTATEALDYLIRSGGTDIVITDIEMAEMTGLEFIAEIKENHLAIGTIIISSYNDFEYARKAMKLEADSYILKQEINENDLIKEVRQIYEQKKKTEFKVSKEMGGMKQFAEERETENLVYRVGVLTIQQAYDHQGNSINGQVNENMLVGLLESVLGHYENGFLFVPYQKEMFIVFQFPKDMAETEQSTMIEDICYDLQQNIKLYINRSLSIGLSEPFYDFKQVLEYHHQALQAASMSFYEEEYPLYYTIDGITDQVFDYTFSSDNFLDEEGIPRLQEELLDFLMHCREERVEVGHVRQSLITKLNILVYKVLHEYSLPESLMEKWDQKFQYFQVISSAGSMNRMVSKIMKVMVDFQSDLLTQLKNDEFSNVFQFVDSHLAGKISLTEMAELNCMSTASFCKKFKERTGMTLIQYINLKKVEQVRLYLKNEDYTLGQIAEMAGFCNENYMIRVFKKITGQTITDFRKGG